MSTATINQSLSARLALAGIGTGALCMTLGVALCAISILQGSLPGWSSTDDALGRLVGVVPGALLIAIGLGLVLRGMHMRITIDVLRTLRGLQQQPTTAPPPRPTTPASHVRRMQEQSTILEAPGRTTTQPEIRASRSEPIKGKPFQPHPIFMARPPK